MYTLHSGIKNKIMPLAKKMDGIQVIMVSGVSNTLKDRQLGVALTIVTLLSGKMRQESKKFESRLGESETLKTVTTKSLV